MEKAYQQISYLFFALLAITLVWNVPALSQVSSPKDKGSCISCEELKNLQLPDIVITETTNVITDASHCKVLGTIGKEINFELLLPTSWNGRFAMGGGGGFAGSIDNFAASSVNRGYATAGTDTGHQGSFLTADWALHNMERQVNFGHLAIHRTAVASKAIIRHFYCSDANYSYFLGCSRGGGQGMMEAQRYPEDFDGIVAGAPAFNWSAFAAELIQNSQAVYPKSAKLNEPVITRENLELLQAAILKHCDAMDGVKDGILNDPRDCDFNFSLLPQCPGEVAGKNCFTPSQLNAIKTIYQGVSHGEVKIYPGYPFGAENEPGGWQDWMVGPIIGPYMGNTISYPTIQFAIGAEIFKYLIFQNPDWDYSSYNFSNFIKDTRYASSYLDATSTDYSDFKKRKGKMIIYHGWNDPGLSALATIEHYEAVEKKDPTVKDYLRLFLLPGVLHCGNGPGPSETDWIELIRQWVEEDKAPERVIVSKTEDGKEQMSRPVYPYPQKAVYIGKGNPNSEKSFK